MAQTTNAFGKANKEIREMELRTTEAVPEVPITRAEMINQIIKVGQLKTEPRQLTAESSRTVLDLIPYVCDNPSNELRSKWFVLGLLKLVPQSELAKWLFQCLDATKYVSFIQLYAPQFTYGAFHND